MSATQQFENAKKRLDAFIAATRAFSDDLAEIETQRAQQMAELRDAIMNGTPANIDRVRVKLAQTAGDHAAKTDELALRSELEGPLREQVAEKQEGWREERGAEFAARLRPNQAQAAMHLQSLVTMLANEQSIISEAEREVGNLDRYIDRFGTPALLAELVKFTEAIIPARSDLAEHILAARKGEKVAAK